MTSRQDARDNTEQGAVEQQSHDFRHNKALLAHRTEPANTVPLCNCRAKAC